MIGVGGRVFRLVVFYPLQSEGELITVDATKINLTVRAAAKEFARLNESMVTYRSVDRYGTSWNGALLARVNPVGLVCPEGWHYEGGFLRGDDPEAENYGEVPVYRYDGRRWTD